MDVKTCGTCKVQKPTTEFYKNASKKDGLSSYCKACKKGYNQSHYTKTKDVWAESRAATRNRRREKCQSFVMYYLETHFCVDCKEDDPVVLEFDHVRDKEYDISRLVSTGNYDKLVAEVEKCEVRRANCHRRKTAERSGGNYRTKT